MKIVNLFFSAALLAQPLAAQGISAIEREILQELSCERDPRPTRILRDLSRSGMIDLDDNIGYDSMSCWRLDGGLEVLGITFVSVCAFEEDADIRSRNTDLYYRGPGTSPGQLIAFGSEIPADDLAAWYLPIFGPARIAGAIRSAEDSWTRLDDPSEVTCSSWTRW